MERKNRGFASNLTSALAAPQDTTAPKPVVARDMIASRTNRLAEMATGASVPKTLYQVDPAKCRMWVHHNRDYAALDFARCQDLIESIKAQGKQEVPAVVRRLHGDPQHDFEVICGARRHWSVAWLRENNYPNIRFLVEPRELTDEEAFRVSDLENRARADLSDYERAKDYLRALGTYYGGKQKDMAERLNVTTSWLSRYLDLARLPAQIVAAFVSPHDLRIKHVTQLKPLMKPEAKYEQVIQRAQELAQARQVGEPMAAAEVIKRLVAAYQDEGAGAAANPAGPQRETLRNSAGKTILTVQKRQHGAALDLRIMLDQMGDKAKVLAAIERLLTEHWPASNG